MLCPNRYKTFCASYAFRLKGSFAYTNWNKVHKYGSLWEMSGALSYFVRNNFSVFQNSVPGSHQGTVCITVNLHSFAYLSAICSILSPFLKTHGSSFAFRQIQSIFLKVVSQSSFLYIRILYRTICMITFSCIHRNIKHCVMSCVLHVCIYFVTISFMQVQVDSLVNGSLFPYLNKNLLCFIASFTLYFANEPQLGPALL